MTGLRDLNLNRLIQPKSIAVFGGSWAVNVVDQCRKMGYTGNLWPVHPTRESVAGVACYKSIDELPSLPDASFLGVNREATIELVAQLSKAGAGGAVCFASGFSEASNEDATAAALEASLIAAAGSMPILGPNCYGFINCLDRALLWPDQHGAIPVSSGVAIVTQSSNIAINLTMQSRGLPIAYVFTAGNQASVSLAQLAMTALEDERVTAVGLHIEGFGSISDFESLAAKAAALGKPIVALKVGKSDAALQALKSHTSSLAGSDAAANAFLQRLGIARVSGVGVFLETLKLFHVGGALPNKQVLSMSCSGGEACLMGDAAVEYGLDCPPLNDAQHKGLREALGSRVALANPLDYHTYIWNDRKAMQAMFAGMLKTDAGIAVLVLDFPRIDRCEYDSWLVAIDAFKAAGENWSGRLAVLASLPENLPETISMQLIEDGVVPLCGLEDAMAAIAAASYQKPNGHYSPVLLASEQAESTSMVALEEDAAKRWLASHGINTPKGVVLLHSEISAQYIDQHCGSFNWPVVLKSTGSLHKSDTGGVVLNIADQNQLQNAIDAMNSSADYFVEEQVVNSVCELLLGIVRDPVHGFLLTVGAGGVQTELLMDSASALLPLSKDQMHSLLRELRCYPLLTGYRGLAACDMDSLLETLMQFQDAATAIADDLYELEVNPLLCTASGTIAVDALLRIDEQSALNRDWT